MNKGLSNTVSIVLIIALAMTLVVGLFFFSETLFGPSTEGEKPVHLNVQPVDPEKGQYTVTNPTEETIVLEYLETADGDICDFGEKVVIEPGGHANCIMPTKRCKMVLWGETSNGKSVSPTEVYIPNCNSIPDISFSTLPPLKIDSWKQTKPDFEQGQFYNTTVNSQGVTLYEKINIPPMITPSKTLTGSDDFGRSLKLGDIDQNGATEILISSPEQNKVRIFSGSQEFSISAVSGAFGSGIALTSEQLIISAPEHDSFKGTLYVFQLPIQSSLTDADAVASISGDTCNYLGVSLANAGDVNNDGFEDLLAGTRVHSGTSDCSSASSGSVHLFYGPIESKTLGQADASFKVSLAGSDFNYSASGAMDLNNDGNADLVIGVPAYDYSKGKAFVFYGPLTGEKSSFDSSVILSGNEPGDFFGYSVSSAGDVNADGNYDLLVGAPGAGKAYLFLGPLGTSISAVDADAVFTGEQGFGRAVGSEDLDSDGFDDVLVGSPKTDYFDREDSGKTHVFYGPLDGLYNSTDFTYKCTKGIIGDLNDDGMVSLFDLFVMTDLIGLGSDPVCIRPFELLQMQDIHVGVEKDIGDEPICCGDVNDDGRINLFDWLDLKNYVYGFKEGLPAGFSCSMRENCFDSKDNDLDRKKDSEDSDCPSGMPELYLPEQFSFYGDINTDLTQNNLGTSIAAEDYDKDGFNDLLLGVPKESIAYFVNGRARTSLMPEGDFLSSEFIPEQKASIKEVSWDAKGDLKVFLENSGEWVEVENQEKLNFSMEKTRLKAHFEKQNQTSPSLKSFEIEFVSPSRVELLYFVNFDKGIKWVSLKKDGVVIEREQVKKCYTFYSNTISIDTSSSYEVNFLDCEDKLHSKTLF